MFDIELVKEKLKSFGQEHLLNFYDELSDIEKQQLLNQINNINFEQISSLYNNKLKKEVEKEISEIEYINKQDLDEEQMKKYELEGSNIIKNGKFAVVTMAGGQGTRLGHEGPKGTYILDIEEKKSIFEILCDVLKKAKQDYGRYVYWYVMTSRENNKDTIDFFEQNQYFDYPKEYVQFFNQGELPMVDINGKILMKSKSKVLEASDGHGGIFEAMRKNNIIFDMKEKGIKWVYIGGVDNILAKMIDPVFIALTKEKKALIGGKSLVKISPEEKVGVFCKKDGRPSVIEYTEISKQLAEQRNENGELRYGEGHILCNLFNIEALEKIVNESLPYHVAFKKCNYLDEKGNIVISTEPCAYKFESFIFDAFEKVDDMLIYRVKREEEFAPIKNKEGIDSVETATKLYCDFWKKL